MEKRLEKIGAELEAVRRDLRDVTRRSREVLRMAKGRRDMGLMAKIRKTLGLS